MLRIRLQKYTSHSISQLSSKKEWTPYFRIVLSDSRKKRDSRPIDILGTCFRNKKCSRIVLNREKTMFHIQHGAQCTRGAFRLLRPILSQWCAHK